MNSLKYFEQININSLQKYIDEINKLEEKKYYFRGQANPNWQLSSSFKRFYETTAMISKPNEKYFLNNFRESSYKINEDDFEYPELEIFSIIQHYGGKTRLIDFTEEADIALFFAISSFENILKIDNLFSFSIYLVSKKIDAQKISKNLKFDIIELEKKINTGNSLYIFKPKYEKDDLINKRIIAQKGLFIFSFNPLDSIKHQLRMSETWTNIINNKNMDKDFGSKRKNYLYKINFSISLEELKNIYKYLKEKKKDYSTLYPDLNGLCMENNVIFN